MTHHPPLLALRDARPPPLVEPGEERARAETTQPGPSPGLDTPSPDGSAGSTNDETDQHPIGSDGSTNDETDQHPIGSDGSTNDDPTSGPSGLATG